MNRLWNAFEVVVTTLHRLLHDLASILDFPFLYVIRALSRFVERLTGRNNFVLTVDLVCLTLALGVYAYIHGHDEWWMAPVLTASLFGYIQFAKYWKREHNENTAYAFAPIRVFSVFVVWKLSNMSIFDSQAIGSVLQVKVLYYSLFTIGLYLLACIPLDPPSRRRKRILGWLHEWVQNSVMPEPQTIRKADR